MQQESFHTFRSQPGRSCGCDPPLLHLPPQESPNVSNRLAEKRCTLPFLFWGELRFDQMSVVFFSSDSRRKHNLTLFPLCFCPSRRCRESFCKRLLIGFAGQSKFCLFEGSKLVVFTGHFYRIITMSGNQNDSQSWLWCQNPYDKHQWTTLHFEMSNILRLKEIFFFLACGWFNIS